MKLLNPLLIPALLLVLSGPLYAEELDPIDIWLANAIDESEKIGGTAIRGEHIAPFIKAQEMWDSELNKTYRELMSALPKSGQEQLLKEQKEWLKSRDKQFKEIWQEQAQYYGTGNAAVMAAESLNVKVIKSRVLELRAMIGAMNKLSFNDQPQQRS